MLVKAVFLHMGYVEYASMGTVFFAPDNNKAFKTPVEAFKNLSAALFQKWKIDCFDENSYWCCNKARSWFHEKFCSSCGKNAKDCPRELENFGMDIIEKFIYWLHTLPEQTAGNSGEEIEGWQRWCCINDLLPLKKSQILEVFYPEPLMAATIRKEYEENLLEKLGKANQTFDELLEKELESRTI